MKEKEGTVVSMKAKMMEQADPLNEQAKQNAVWAIEKYLERNDKPLFMMLLARDINYYTFFWNKKNLGLHRLAKEIFDFLDTDSFLVAKGPIKEIVDNGDYIEIWCGDQFFALFNGEGFVVDL